VRNLQYHPRFGNLRSLCQKSPTFGGRGYGGPVEGDRSEPPRGGSILAYATSDCLPVQEIFSFGIDGGEFIASLQYTNGFLAAQSGTS